MKKVMAAIALIMMVSGTALAHSGGTDANGCHAGKKPYHCHWFSVRDSFLVSRHYSSFRMSSGVTVFSVCFGGFCVSLFPLQDYGKWEAW